MPLQLTLEGLLGWYMLDLLRGLNVGRLPYSRYPIGLGMCGPLKNSSGSQAEFPKARHRPRNSPSGLQATGSKVWGGNQRASNRSDLFTEAQWSDLFAKAPKHDGPICSPKGRYLVRMGQTRLGSLERNEGGCLVNHQFQLSDSEWALKGRKTSVLKSRTFLGSCRVT